MDHWSILLAYSAHPAILAALAPRIRFSLHKEFREGEIRLSLPKEFRAAGIGFLIPTTDTILSAAEIGISFSFPHTTLAQKMYSFVFFLIQLLQQEK